MTLESTLIKKTYAGNGVAREFPVPFPVLEASHVRLMHTDANGTDSPMSSNYRVNMGDGSAVTVTVPISGQPIQPGCRLTVYRDVPRTQVVDLENAGAFHPEVLEKMGFDRIVMMIQEMQAHLDRCVSVSITSDMSPEEYVAYLFEQITKTRDYAEACRKAAEECRALFAKFPTPAAEDAGKVLGVRLVAGVPSYVLTPMSGGGGGGTGFAEYVIDVVDPCGRVDVSLTDIGHPEMPGVFFPILNILSGAPYLLSLVSTRRDGFTVQIYKPGGEPGVVIGKYIACGTFVCGEGKVCGDAGAATVRLAVCIPMPAL